MYDRIRFILNRVSERLWVKPLLMCILSIAGAFAARTADYTKLGGYVPNITTTSIETLLSIISTSMLVIATFAVASMVTAYASASNTATPRSFSLVIADDVSQNALSAFIGAFIFSIVSLVAVENSYYDKAGRFALFVLTILVFVIVIIMFVRWVDRIARLGRLGTTIEKVEAATGKALEQRRCAPTLCGVAVGHRPDDAKAIYGNSIGYVQRVDLPKLQSYAEEYRFRIEVTALPGTFTSPGRVLAYMIDDEDSASEYDVAQIADTFLIGKDRTFDEDPRFGLVVLSEIASRALSPGINDPGTAIDVIGAFVRLFANWARPLSDDEPLPVRFDRIAIPELSLHDMFDDAFGALARDGASTIEVIIRLLKAFESFTLTGNADMRDVALQHARLALDRAENSMTFEADLKAAHRAARFTNSD